MARTEISSETVQVERDEASLPEPAPRVTQDATELHAVSVAIAKKQVVEIARALARMAAREDDAAERNQAGRAQAEAAAKSAKRRAGPIGNG